MQNQVRHVSFFRLIIIGFTAGFIAVPLFHQILLSLFYMVGWSSLIPFNFKLTQPFGVPVVLSLSFWGGVWGILFALSIGRYLTGAFYWLASVIGSALVLSAVYGLVVAPLKGVPAADLSGALIGLMLNGAWGLGTAFLFKQMIFKTLHA